MIHVLATIELSPGRRDAFLAEFRPLVPLVLGEDGCLEYGAAVDLATDLAVQPPARPDVVTIVEKWASVDHLRQHLAAPHMEAYRPRVQDLVTRTTLVILTPV